MMVDDFLETSLSSIRSLNSEMEDMSSKKKEIEDSISSKRKAIEEIRNNILIHMNENCNKKFSKNI
jgi:predicted  nucleic acid-binding Zn-ribbon protein